MAHARMCAPELASCVSAESKTSTKVQDPKQHSWVMVARPIHRPPVSRLPRGFDFVFDRA